MGCQLFIKPEKIHAYFPLYVSYLSEYSLLCYQLSGTDWICPTCALTPLGHTLDEGEDEEDDEGGHANSSECLCSSCIAKQLLQGKHRPEVEQVLKFNHCTSSVVPK